MHRGILGMVSAFAVMALAASALSGCGVTPAAATATVTPVPTAHYAVTYQEVNHSGVSGTAQLDLVGHTLTVTIHAKGLEPNKEHYQHIHGLSGTQVSCPTKATGGGLITVDEGLAAVGPVAWDLAPYANVGDAGTIDWTHSYTLDAVQLANLGPLTEHVMVLHGLTDHGVYDRAIFVACGAIQAV